MMEAFGLLGPLPFGWECKIETKLGRLYFIDHENKNTTWNDPRLISFPTPPYHVAVQQPSAYFEDTSGSWSSPVPSVRGFSLHRRGSSPRLGSANRIAPSPTPSPRNSKRNELQSIVLESSGARGGGAMSSCSQFNEPPTTPANVSSRSSGRGGTVTSQTNFNLGSTSVDLPSERPTSARSFSSSSYCPLSVPASFLASCDSETAFRTVCSLFPTAGEPQIRHLFHKYHNRANLVLSALQVAKHPLASELSSQKNFNDGKDGDTDTVITSIPGDTKSLGMQSPLKMNSSYGTDSPARTGTPVSLLKFSNNQSSVGSLFTRWGSPQLSMSPQLNLVREGSSNKAQKSPKIKLKYLKGIFPAADETFLLDVLASCENNVQKASDKMLQKGFSRTPPPKPARHKWFEVKNLIEKRQKAINQTNMANIYHQAMGEPLESPFPTPLLKPARPHLTAQDKEKSKEYLRGKFPNLPERFVSWALEASKFDKVKAETLLREVGPATPDEFKSFVVGSKLDEGKKISFADTVIEVMENNNVSVSPDKSKEEVGDDENLDTPDSGYYELEAKARKKNFITNLFNLKPKAEGDKTSYTNSAYARGPNSSLAKGPNPDLITTTYIQTTGGRTLHKGPNYALRQGPKGAQGPNVSLAKGSMWSKAKNVKSNSSKHNSVIVSVEG